MDKIKQKPEIRWLQTLMHLAMATEYITQKEGTIWWPGNSIDGKKVNIDSTTKRNGEIGIGKTKSTIYLSETPKLIFKTTKDFLDHYSNK